MAENTTNPYFTRADRLDALEFPQTTTKKIIVKCNNEAIGFRFDCYPEDILADSIPKEYFDITVRNCHKIVERSYLKKKNEERIDYSKGTKKLLYLVSAILFVAIIIFITFGNKPENYDTSGLKVVTVLFVVLICMVLILAACKTFFTNPQFTNVDEDTVASLKAYLAEENKGIYKDTAYEWKIGKDYFWLELIYKDNKSPNKLKKNLSEPEKSPLKKKVNI